MQMEAETISMLIWGFIIIISLSLVIILKWWFNSRNNALLWFVVQFVFLSLGFYKFLDLIRRKIEIPAVMISEENSLSLGLIGLFWAASMISMIIGVYFLNRNNFD
jgi:hypothetical protein